MNKGIDKGHVSLGLGSKYQAIQVSKIVVVWFVDATIRDERPRITARPVWTWSEPSQRDQKDDKKVG